LPRRGVHPGRLRRRLTIAFVLVAGISAGALALGSYLLVRQTRLGDSLSRSKTEALRELRAAGDVVAHAPSGAFDVQNLLAGPESSDIHALLVAGSGAPTPSVPSVDPSIPNDLRTLVGQGQLAYRRITFGGSHYLMIGSRIPGSLDQLYLLFSEQSVYHDLDRLRDVLLVGWGAVVLLAALVGRALARGTLEPVGRASEAARHIAEGLLDTRLEESGEDEFGAWAASFNRMAEALEAKVEALSEAQARERRFTSDVAHELRTPVAALVGEASLLREHLDRIPEDARRPAELIVQDVGRLRRLVEELMEVSRLDAGREPIQTETVDIEALIGAVVRSRGWGDRVVIETDGGTLSTDRRRLERVVANLVGNAIEHGGREVRVWAGRDAGRLAIEVNDRGPGISAEHLPHLFERFYKADPSRTGSGSGLGLAIAAENVRLLGGDIEVRSEVGVGTQFRVLLPVTEPLRAGDGPVAGQADHGAQSPSSKGGTP
jgi:two-component system sensor histidine kinase MtrB